jgi:hypothetical protein
MGWAMLYLFVALKIPIAALCWIVWWAVHQEPEAADAPRDDGGTKRRPHPPRPLPRRPRRGPHGDPAPLPPPRVRTRVTARARRVER